MNLTYLVKTFFDEIASALPQYKLQLTETLDGTVTSQLSSVGRLLNWLIVGANEHDFKIVVEKINACITNNQVEFTNQIAVCILEHLDFGPNHGFIDFLPSSVLREYNSIRHFNASLLEDADFMKTVNEIFRDADVPPDWNGFQL